MRFLSILFLCAFSYANAATIIGTNLDVFGSAVDTRLKFQPKSTPLAYGGATVGDVPRGVQTTNGAWSIGLIGGRYDVTDGAGLLTHPLAIYVPFNDTNTYTLNDVARLAANVGLWAFTNSEGLMSYRVRIGTNFSLITNNAGTIYESVTASGQTDTNVVNDIISGSYLPLTGGTMTGIITNAQFFAGSTPILTLDSGFAEFLSDAYVSTGHKLVGEDSLSHQRWRLNGSDGSATIGGTLDVTNDIIARANLWNTNGSIYLLAYPTGNAGSFLYFIGTNGVSQGYIRVAQDHAGANTPEMAFVSSLDFAFVPGVGGTGHLGQTPPSGGIGGATHNVFYLHRQITPDVTTPLGFSCPLAFVQWYRDNSNANKARAFAFMHNGLDRSGGSELAIYSSFAGYNQTFSDDVSNVQEGAFGIGKFRYSAGHLTNGLNIGAATGQGIPQDAFNSVNPCLSIASGGIAAPGMILGADVNAVVRTDGHDKFFQIGLAAKDNSTCNSFVRYETDGGDVYGGNAVMFGRGGGPLKGIQGWEFFAAASQGDGGPTGAANCKLGVGSDGVRLGSGSSTPITKVLSASATLDFGSTSAQTSSELTITVTGAAVGDVVSMGTPAAPNANSCYTAYVSATDTVTVRFNNYSTGAIDPASGSFRVMVMHF